MHSFTEEAVPPPPSLAGCFVVLFMLAAPFVGYRYLGLGGAIGGLALGNLGSIWFFFLRRRRDLTCEACGQPIINRRSGSELGDRLQMPGATISSADMMSGRMSPGSQCKRCGRLYCGCSYPQTECACGSSQLRTVALEYPGRSWR